MAKNRKIVHHGDLRQKYGEDKGTQASNGSIDLDVDLNKGEIFETVTEGSSATNFTVNILNQYDCARFWILIDCQHAGDNIAGFEVNGTAVTVDYIEALTGSAINMCEIVLINNALVVQSSVVVA